MKQSKHLKRKYIGYEISLVKVQISCKNMKTQLYDLYRYAFFLEYFILQLHTISELYLFSKSF